MPLLSPDEHAEALWFAASAHGAQRVPGTELPYLLHLTMVHAEVLSALAHHPERDARLAQLCALLHDTIEDANVTRAELAARFGDAVAAGVDALSKRAELPKAEQMHDSLRRIEASPPEVAMVKLADRTANMRRPPEHWSRDKRISYRTEAELIVTRLGASSAPMANRLRQKIAEYEQYL